MRQSRPGDHGDLIARCYAAQSGASPPPGTLPCAIAPGRTGWLLLAESADRTAKQQSYIDRLYAICIQAALAVALDRTFHTLIPFDALVRERDVSGFYW
jgi:hypothetical protein